MYKRASARTELERRNGGRRRSREKGVLGETFGIAAVSVRGPDVVLYPSRRFMRAYLPSPFISTHPYKPYTRTYIYLYTRCTRTFSCADNITCSGRPRGLAPPHHLGTAKEGFRSKVISGRVARECQRPGGCTKAG